jgi:acyl carrier protein
MTTVGARVKDVIRVPLSEDGPVELPDDALLVDVGVESLRLLDLLVRVEQEFSLTIADHAVFAARLRTVGDFVDFVEQQLLLSPATTR